MAIATSNAELAKKIDALAEGIVASNAALNTRLSAIEAQQSKVVEAIYGNGGPGIKETLRNHDTNIRTMMEVGGPKVQEIEDDVKKLISTHAGCNIGEVSVQLGKIAERHDKEDEQRKEHKEITLDNRRENRKWFMGLAAAAATSIIITLLNVIYEYIRLAPHLTP